PTVSGAAALLVARYATPFMSNWYPDMFYTNVGVYQAYLYLNKAGAYTQLAVTNLTGFTGTGNVRFEVVGKELKLFVNNVVQAVEIGSASCRERVGMARFDSRGAKVHA